MTGQNVMENKFLLPHIHEVVISNACECYLGSGADLLPTDHDTEGWMKLLQSGTINPEIVIIGVQDCDLSGLKEMIVGHPQTAGRRITAVSHRKLSSKVTIIGRVVHWIEFPHIEEYLRRTAKMYSRT